MQDFYFLLFCSIVKKVKPGLMFTFGPLPKASVSAKTKPPLSGALETGPVVGATAASSRRRIRKSSSGPAPDPSMHRQPRAGRIWKTSLLDF